MIQLKKLFVLFTLFFLLVPSISHAGSIKDNETSGSPGLWYLGETPASVATSKHPILFVHGLNSASNTWWENNDMYNTAFQNGYETSFIDLYPTKNMWDNGALLADRIQDIYQHFGEKVVIVAHSKGGIDTQSALVHYGADPYVERVITLSTPHHGSQLADLAYSSWAGWLAGILGSKNDATYSLQTGYMEYFRSQTDNQPNLYTTPIYTFGGTKWGSFGSSLYWGGLYLRAYGSNDGAVTVKSSRLPYATELAVGDWNHTTIKKGSSTFSLFQNYLNENLYSFKGLRSASTEKADKKANQYVSGGQYSGQETETIEVESGAQSVTFDWMSDQADTELKLISPDKTVKSTFTTNTDESGYFKGAYHHTATVEKPEAGTWTIEADSDEQEHYLLNTTFQSGLNDALHLALENDAFKLKTQQLQAKTTMTIEYYKNGKLKQAKVKVNKKNGSYKLPDLGDGVYNMTIDIKGKYKKEEFERTFIESVYVDPQGNLYQ
ncbi:lipase family alpha/beta hydrolase [Halobacillus salinus]|uniref:GPI inositol-deacylase PGAP1-like alpha/beta domain-containing protein n=1 Tax=Halobacillus salinus TaxID=192814 RepID=A0A4Z0GYM9_9BACI|nr:hypothetical protein [Halobacillus salinus]TGB02924.1 hypothetical protein E4663_12300 [Halobacillus salinus]